MTLDAYLRAEGAPSAADFAAKLRISEPSLSRIRKGQQNIKRDLMRDIIVATGGKVTAADLLFRAPSEKAAA